MWTSLLGTPGTFMCKNFNVQVSESLEVIYLTKLKNVPLPRVKNLYTNDV